MSYRTEQSAKKGGAVKFSRGSGSGGRHSADDPRRSGRHSRPGDDGESAGYDGSDGAARDRTTPHRRTPAVTDDVELNGPYDITEAPAGVVRVDLGSLQIPSIEGVEVRVQANAEGVIQQVVLAYEGSALQLGVFAAPRTEGIWDEVREEIRTSLFSDGVAVEEVRGTYGTELRARVRNTDGMMDLRFIGIDGPRWMLRAVYQGAAAADPSSAGPLGVCLRGLVVDRGREAMPVREALPLRLPREIAEAAKANAAAQNAPAAADQGASAQASTNNGSVYGSGVNGSAGTVYGGGTNSVNGNSGNGAAPTPAVESDNSAADRRRPSPRPRRSE